MRTVCDGRFIDFSLFPSPRASYRPQVVRRDPVRSLLPCGKRHLISEAEVNTLVNSYIDHVLAHVRETVICFVRTTFWNLLSTVNVTLSCPKKFESETAIEAVRLFAPDV